MPSPTEITVSQLSRLVGLPHSPAIVDLRADEDFASDPRLIPCSQRRPVSTTLATVLSSGSSAMPAASSRAFLDASIPFCDADQLT